MNDTNTDQLITLLSHPDGTTRRQAALALGVRHDGTPAAASALIERLVVEGDSCVREDLTWATVQHIDQALPQVLGMLDAESADTRRTGAHVLSKAADPAHLDALAPLLADPHADVAIKAYRAVANTGRPEALPLLATRLGDGDALQKDALTGAFFRFGADAVPALVTALGSDAARVREHAADALGHLGEDAAGGADALAALASDPEADVRLAALAALSQLGEEAAAQAAAFAGDPDPRVAAVASRLG
ncbi:HEAT repeat domain-containing protein [Propioniciclava coleopterorum]|uniref:HEAT repeat domain-containing protein n=1 Tax=Propioniciclava coleopterorum TaxID=2714937 RepID=A0A6G7Y6H7_9ACTN|nr:HEAT repeat domain-containing protein [Propioniciclava coleopterorum]QIK72319.1 HEAT repeat domain-containing protein [Propioniciclava coleopterorum]